MKVIKSIIRWEDGSITETNKRPSPPPETVRPMTKFSRLMRSIRIWNSKGRPMASKELRRSRLLACRECAYWSSDGNLWLGECRHRSCGCSKFKAWLATEKCPILRWPAISSNNPQPPKT